MPLTDPADLDQAVVMLAGGMANSFNKRAAELHVGSDNLEEMFIRAVVFMIESRDATAAAAGNFSNVPYRWIVADRLRGVHIDLPKPSLPDD